MAIFPKPDVDRIMRWLHANGSIHQASQIIDGSIHAEGERIAYEIFVPPSGRHRINLEQVVRYHEV